jgi:O-antigen/teichoic acid export membrane protein
MVRFYRTIFYVASFGFARGGQFVAPIILANILAPRFYGILELAQAIGSMVSTILALGTSAAVPLVLVRNIEQASWRGILLHQTITVAALLIAATIGWQMHVSTAVWLGGLCAATMMLQALWSVTCKSNGKGEASLLLDAGFWGVLATAAGLAFLIGFSTMQVWSITCSALLIYFFALGAWTAYRLGRTSVDDAGFLYRSTIKTGFPLMSISLLALLATTAGRLGIGLLSSPEVTAQYGALFRATALPMVAHQIVMVARFRRLFEMDDLSFTRVVRNINIFVISCVIAFWLASDLAGFLLGAAFRQAFAQHRTEGLLILTQTVLWAAIAINDLTNNRKQTAGSAARATAIYFAFVIPGAWGFLASREVTLALFVPVHSFVMCGYYLTQIYVMRSCGIHMWRVWGLALGAFIGLSLLAELS